jgi:preprotein translocase subunit SecE
MRRSEATTGSSPSAPDYKMNIFTKTIKFLKEVKQELGKVSWSNREELIGSTVVVIVITSFTAVFIGIIDLMLSKILSVVFK